ncbi:hypothetical protein BJY04DRAFT_191751 [Aspergillus karnatakaensis]|uniref:uncharacterized protein n=1 Tax=Aspergillus karnatakaensis TaxID=1810916 RepID=UPI003CCD9D27
MRRILSFAFSLDPTTVGIVLSALFSSPFSRRLRLMSIYLRWRKPSCDLTSAKILASSPFIAPG